MDAQRSKRFEGKMESPQLENGYIKIANEIMEIFAKTNIPSSERQVIDSIIRKTYGFHKKEDNISISQIIEMTGLSRRMVIYALQNLEAKNMIIIKREKSDRMLNSINKISFQKNHKLWVVQRKSKQYCNLLDNMKVRYKEGSAKKQIEVVQRIEGSAKNDDLVVQRTENNSEFFAPTKDTITKDTITKNKETIKERFDEFYKAYPNKTGKLACLKAWEKLKPNKELLDKMLIAIEEQKQWRLNAHGEFRPPWKNPATWLNAGCWEDEITKGNGNGKQNENGIRYDKDGFKMVSNPVRQQVKEIDRYE